MRCASSTSVVRIKCYLVDPQSSRPGLVAINTQTGWCRKPHRQRTIYREAVGKERTASPVLPSMKREGTASLRDDLCTPHCDCLKCCLCLYLTEDCYITVIDTRLVSVCRCRKNASRLHSQNRSLQLTTTPKCSFIHKATTIATSNMPQLF